MHECSDDEYDLGADVAASEHAMQSRVMPLSDSEGEMHAVLRTYGADSSTGTSVYEEKLRQVQLGKLPELILSQKDDYTEICESTDLDCAVVDRYIALCDTHTNEFRIYRDLQAFRVYLEKGHLTITNDPVYRTRYQTVGDHLEVTVTEEVLQDKFDKVDPVLNDIEHAMSLYAEMEEAATGLN